MIHRLNSEAYLALAGGYAYPLSGIREERSAHLTDLSRPQGRAEH
jgi:hypothetical protein